MTRSISEQPIDLLPQHIAQRLVQLTRRARGVAAAKGIAYTVAAFLASMLAGIGADVFVPMLWPATAMWFTPITRVCITLTAVAVTVCVAVYTLVRPLRHRYSLVSAAMTLEQDHPELQERISTTVQLMLSRDASVFRGSEEMIRHVAAEADTDSTRVSPKQVIRSNRARRVALAVGAVLAGIAAVGAVWPDRFGLYVQRFAVPWNETAQFRLTKVESLTGSRQVPRMEPLVIEARSSGLRASKATLYVNYADGRSSSLSVSAEEQGVAGGQPGAAGGGADGPLFRFVIARVQESFIYRVRANDGVTQPHRVTAVDRPAVVRMDLIYDYPEYTGLSRRIEKDAMGPVKALQHTQVTVRFATNRELDSDASFLVIENEAAAASQPDRAAGSTSGSASGSRKIPLTRIEGTDYEAGFEVAGAPSQYHFELSSGGLASLLTPDRRFAVMADPDSPPRVKILAPAGQVALRSDDKLPIGYEASDDYGLSAGQISYSIDGGEWKNAPIPLAADGPKRMRAQTVFDLAKLGVDLSAALRIDYQVQVADNLPAKFGGPQWAASGRQRIMIDPKVSDYQARLAETMRETFADEVAKVDKELRAALSDVQAIQKAMLRVPVMDPPQGKYTQIALGHLTAANDLALAAAGKSQFSNYERMGVRLGDIATAHIQPARQLTGQSKDLADQPDPRKDKLVQAEWHIQRALEKLNQVSREFTDLIKTEDKADKLAQMAQKQDVLATQADDEITDPNQLAKMTKEQMDLLDKSRAMLKADKDQAMEPLFDVAAKAEKTLQEKIQDVVAEQKDLTRQTEQAEKLAALEKKAAELAQRQDALGKNAAAFEKSQAAPLAKADAAVEADKPMAEAAAEIKTHDFPEALAKQQSATTQLDEAAKKTAAVAAAATTQPENAPAELNKNRQEANKLQQLATQARQLAKQEQQIAQQTEAAKASAEQSAKQAQDEAAKADRQLAELARKQQELADKSDKLQKEAAAKLPAPDAQAAAKEDSTPQARQAAEQLTKQAPAAAAVPAQQAEQKDRQLAAAMDQAAKAHDQAAQAAQAAAKAAAENQPEAKQAAQGQADEQKRQAEAAKQVGEQARQLAAQQQEINKQLAQAQAAQAAAQPQQAQAAQAATRQLADLAKKQQSAAAEVQQLQKQAAAAPNEAARKEAAEHDAATPAAEAAAKMPGEPAPAAKAEQKAADQLGELATGLEEAAKPAAEKVAKAEQAQRNSATARQASAQAESLKGRQEQLTRETKELGEEFAKAREELTNKQLADLTEKQQQVAQKAADLADNVAKQPADEAGQPQPDQPNPDATKAAAAAKAAADELAQERLPQANAQQKQAQGELEKLAGQLTEQAAKEAGVNPQQQQMAAAQAAEAGKLAEQQRELAEQVANLSKQDPLANLPVRQEALKQQTQDLGEQAKMVADFMQQIAPQAGELARQAAQQLAEKAPAAQAQAAQAMRQDQMAQARQAQQQATAAAEKAEELFNKAADEAAQAADASQGGDNEPIAERPLDEPGEPGKAAAEDPNPFDPLAQAAWAQAQAQAAMKKAAAAQQAQQQLAKALAQAQAAAAAKQAGQQLGQAAQKMAQQVASMAQGPSQQPGEQTELYMPAWVSRFGSRGGAPDLRRLNFELGLTPSEWNRLPGYIQQEVIQASKEKVPQEYRELIKRYFQAISQQASPP